VISLEFSDEKIVALCKLNDIHGFDSLYTKYEKYIYKLCYYYTNSKEDSLDLLQDIYIKLYKSINNFDESKPLIPWIKRISINTCQNYLRDNKNVISASRNSRLPDDITNNNFSLYTVEDEVNFNNTKHAINSAIKDLPNEYKSVIVLRHVECLSYKEISEYTSIPIGTVKTYLYRGRKLIKEYLKKEGIWEV